MSHESGVALAPGVAIHFLNFAAIEVRILVSVFRVDPLYSDLKYKAV